MALLAALVAHVGTSAIHEALARLSLASLALPLAIVLLDALVRAESWRLLLRLHGVVAGRSVVISSHLAGTAYGIIVPSSLGTDAARTWLLARSGVTGTSSVSSMLGLNLLNLFAVLIVSTLATFVLREVPALAALRASVPLTCAAYAVLLALLLSSHSPLPRVRGWLPRYGSFARIAHWLSNVAEELHALRSHPRTLAALLLIAIVNQLLSVATVVAVGRALALDVPMSSYLVVVPLFTLARLVPMSVAGFGGDQLASVILFGAVGVGGAASAAISLVQAAVVDAYAFVCGIWALVVSGRCSSRHATPRTNDDDRR